MWGHTIDAQLSWYAPVLTRHGHIAIVRDAREADTM